MAIREIGWTHKGLHWGTKTLVSNDRLPYPMVMEIEIPTGYPTNVAIPHSFRNPSSPTPENLVTYDYWLNWGDSPTYYHITHSGQTQESHVYASTGTYTVTISGRCEQFGIREHSNYEHNEDFNFVLYLNKIVSWGNVFLKYLRIGYKIFSNNINFIPSDTRKAFDDMVNFDETFSYTSLTSIPEDIFNRAENITSFNGCFTNSKLTTIPVDIFKKFTGVTSMSGIFQIPTLTSIPEDIFKYNTEIISFSSMFQCNVNIIPENLFRYNTKVTRFNYLFTGCLISSTIPENLFKYNTEVTNTYGMFMSSRLLSSYIPNNLFLYNTKITNMSFLFFNSQDLTTTPDIFKNHTSLITVSNAFDQCEYLTSISNTLFSGCTNINDFSGTFHNCVSLTGNAPELWNSYPSANGEYCFSRCFGLSNYSSIPSDWKQS